MSKLTKIKDELTPEGGSSFLGYAVAIGLELLAKLGPVGVFLLTCLLLVFMSFGVFELVRHFA